MSSIQITNNAKLDITATSADGNATLNRYLKGPLTFVTPAGIESLIDTKVSDVDLKAFPVQANATGAGQFAVAGTALNVHEGASTTLRLLRGGAMSDVMDAIQMKADAAVDNLVSFAIQGTLTAEDTANVSDFGFGINAGATVTLSTFSGAAGSEMFVMAAERAVAGLTIPHDVTDLKSLPANTIQQLDATSCLKFTASVTYNVLNDPLSTTSLSKLPPIAINANASATVEATVTHVSDHTITLAKLKNGMVHLAVSISKTDDFETSLTASAGATAKVGSTDALTFLLQKISPKSSEEMAKINADMPPEQAAKLSGDIKAAIDAAVSSTLQVSLKAALDDSESRNRVFLYEIDLAALDGDSTAAVQAALKGDFTAITKPGAAPAGIRAVDSVFTKTSKVTHSLTVHLLGIFNFGSTNAFLEKSKVDYTKDTHEIVLSDESIDVDTNNLDAEKLRELVVKAVTLTIPASANTPEAVTPLTMVYFDRQGSASGSDMRQFVNVLQTLGVPAAASAGSLLNQKLKHYGATSLYLGLNLTPGQCRQLFIDSTGKPFDAASYVERACAAQATILSGDADNADRLKLYRAGADFWKELGTQGSGANISRVLGDQGIGQHAVVDVITVVWWSSAMESYAKALAQNGSLEKVGKAVVQDDTRGFNEPWLILATWAMLGKPALDCRFMSSLIKQAAGASTV